MSRFDVRKGIYELLAAFAKIAGDFPDTQLIFAGDGAENDRLRASATSHPFRERITFYGYITGREKAELLQNSTIFALPTYYPEGMPVALLEAMAAGKPLLTSKAGGIKHIIRESENGVVLDEVTVETVAAALRKLLGDANYRTETGARNAKYAWENFEAKTVTAKIEAVYNDIAQS